MKILILYLQLNVLLSKEKWNGTKFHLVGLNLDILYKLNVCSYHVHFVFVMYFNAIPSFYMTKRLCLAGFVENIN